MNRKGECPVYCRVTLNETLRSDFSTGIFLLPSEWDRKRSVPLNNLRQAITRLADIQKGVYASISVCENKGVYAPSEIVSHYKNSSQKTVYTLVNMAHELLQKEKPSPESSRKIAIAVNQFTSICRGDVYSHTPETIKGFVNEAGKTMSPVTVKKKLEYIKRIFCYGFNRGYISRNPFAGIEEGFLHGLRFI